MNVKFKKSMFPILLAVISAIALIGGAIWQYNEKEAAKAASRANEQKAEANQAKADANQKKADEFNRRLSASQDSLLQETKKTSSATSELNNVYKKLAETTEKLNAGQEETLKRILGYGTPWIRFIIHGKGHHSLRLESDSKYQMYDLLVTVANMDEVNKCKKIVLPDMIILDENCPGLEKQLYGPSTLSPTSQGIAFNSINLVDGYNHYQIEFFARHGTFVRQYIVYLEETKIVSIADRLYVLVDGNYKLESTELKGKIDKINITEDYWNRHFFPHFNVAMQQIE